ncbi:MFS transporter [Vibrio sinensis]|uniref:MFS transporter n=1 Tax=Vibrio sinensis TaxID=2302434 RepID=A0A3A6QH66_9VIBR|nr:multidrug effflux MFS transporter [Vibrio sinensis]RJX71973.1 MFS transporter [Vibrio sinensis]
MSTKPSLWLMVVMLMFPQIVETIYSPALGSIAHSFAVTYTQAAQTLSVYFFSFAIGVVVWGVLADKWGRRSTMMVGLFIYGCAALLAMQTESFTTLMVARALSAFGIAVGSVVTQTMLRDVFSGDELGQVFSLMGTGIAISPVIGMWLGGQLTQAGGYHYVFVALFVMAAILLMLNLFKLPETQKEKQPLQLGCLMSRMVRDTQIWQSALLVALYNIALFAYYQLGAFIFVEQGFSAEQFGYSGIALGFGTLLGSYANKILLSKGMTQDYLLWIAATLLTLGAGGVYMMQASIWFVVPVMFVVMSFGIAIPNVLSTALADYKHYVGSAGALFGLMYYSLIAGGLALAGAVQHLGMALIACSLAALLVTAIRTSQR